jgi:hypothetical protein
LKLSGEDLPVKKIACFGLVFALLSTTAAAETLTFKCAFGPNDNFPGFYTFNFSTHVVSYYGGGAPGEASNANSAARSAFVVDGSAYKWSNGQINYMYDYKHHVFTETFTRQGLFVATSCVRH